jgi:hypothetical protein
MEPHPAAAILNMFQQRAHLFGRQYERLSSLHTRRGPRTELAGLIGITGRRPDKRIAFGSAQVLLDLGGDVNRLDVVERKFVILAPL